MARARRGRGEGSIGQLPSGLWYADASGGFTSEGRRVRKRVYAATKQKVQQKLRELHEKADRGALGREGGKITVGQYLDQWLKDIAVTVAPTTLRSYTRDVTLYIKPTVGPIRLSHFAVHHVKAMYSKLADMKKSPAMQKKAGVTLGVAMQQAVGEGLLSFNPARMIKKPKHKPAEIKPLDPEQVSRFLAAAIGDRLHALYVVALDSGAREGELLGLQWKDVDFAGGALSITRTLQELDGELTLKDTKTATSRRRVPLSEFGLAALHEHRKRMLAEGNCRPDAIVFCTPAGEPWYRSSLHRISFKPLLAKAGLPSIRFYDLRHTSATLLLLAGEPAKIAAERLGHSTIVLTLDTYSHVTEGMQKRATEKLDAILRAVPSAASM